MSEIKIEQLTAEQKTQLLQQLQCEEKNKETKRKHDIEVYQHLKDVTVKRIFKQLQIISSNLELSKKDIYDEFNTLIELKNELYNVDETQFSHSWTSEDGNITIITGHNIIDRWDETVSVGITKVNNWLNKQINDANSSLISIIRELLKPNKAGVLKVNRVLDLQNHAEKIGDAELIEAVKIIRQAHRPDRSSTYIKAKYKDADGVSQFLGLSMSSV